MFYFLNVFAVSTSQKYINKVLRNPVVRETAFEYVNQLQKEGGRGKLRINCK